MRHVFACTLLWSLAIPLAQTTPSRAPQTQARAPVLSTSAASVRDWTSRLTSVDPKVRAIAEAALVEGSQRSLPLLRRFLTDPNEDDPNEDLHRVTFEIIRRIGPPAIPMLVELLRDYRASIRASAADAFIDLAPDTESVQPALRRALNDEDSMVAGDAARALGALGPRASPSVGALVKTLSHDDPYVRVFAAEALASIGPKAAEATGDLARTIGDPEPGVRWAACEALAGIGPAASSAVPELILALEDEFLYVRMFAAGALGSIGPKAYPALAALKKAATDPAVRSEAEWAVSRIAGVESGTPVVSPILAGPSVASKPHAPLARTGNPPVDWDADTGRNVVWSMELGYETYGRPVVADGVVYVGTDNGMRMNRAYREKSGVLLAFRAADGQFLWQDVGAASGPGHAGVPAADNDRHAVRGRQSRVLRHRRVPTAQPRHTGLPRWREQRSVSARDLSGRHCGRHCLGAGHVRPSGCVSP
jgi:HEAT repeat protein